MTEIRINAADLEININVGLSQRENASPNGWEKEDRDDPRVKELNSLYAQMDSYVTKLSSPMWSTLTMSERSAVRGNLTDVWHSIRQLLSE